jgi:hypothetical protein
MESHEQQHLRHKACEHGFRDKRPEFWSWCSYVSVVVGRIPSIRFAVCRPKKRAALLPPNLWRED